MRTQILQYSLTTLIKAVHRNQYILWLCFAVFLYKIPFVFDVLLHGDEASFMLVAISLLEGYLPYEQYWDNKPPLIFLAYAAALLVYGEYYGIFILGSLVLLGNTLMVFQISKKQKLSANWSFMLALCYLALSYRYFLMSEQLATLFLLIVITLTLGITKDRYYNVRLTFIGFFLAAMVLTKTNYAVFAISVSIFYLAVYKEEIWPTLFSLSIGASLMLLLVITPYALKGLVPLLYKSIVIVPLADANTENIFNSLIGLLNKIFTSNFLLSFFLFLTSIAVCIVKKNINKPNIFILITVVSLLVSIALKGQNSSYYLSILTAPMLIGITVLLKQIRSKKKLQIGGFILLLSLIVGASDLFINRIHKHVISLSTEKKYHRTDTVKASDFLNATGSVKTNNVLFVSNTLGHVLTSTRVPNYVVHPFMNSRPNIVKHLYKNESMRSRLEKIVVKMDFIVISATHRPYDREAWQYLQKELNSEFKKVKTFGRIQIYERI